MESLLALNPREASVLRVAVLDALGVEFDEKSNTPKNRVRSAYAAFVSGHSNPLHLLTVWGTAEMISDAASDQSIFVDPVIAGNKLGLPTDSVASACRLLGYRQVFDDPEFGSGFVSAALGKAVVWVPEHEHYARLRGEFIEGQGALNELAADRPTDLPAARPRRRRAKLEE